MLSRLFPWILITFLLSTALSAGAAPGHPDTSFNSTGTAQMLPFFGTAQALVRQPVDGKLVVVGSRLNGSNRECAVIRYNPDGTLDTAFNTTGSVFTAVGFSSEAMAVALQSDGKIVTAGYSNNGSNDSITIVRYTSAGAADTSFGNSGVITPTVPGSYNSRALAVAIDSSDRILIAGYADNSGAVLVRYTKDGALDSTFGSNGIVTRQVYTNSDQATCITIQPDSMIVIGIATANGTVGLARYTDTGVPDTSFGTMGAFQYSAGAAAGLQGLALQPADGAIVAVGYSQNLFGSRDILLLRVTAAGNADFTFGSNGIVTTDINSGNDGASGVAVQNNGKIVLVGSTSDQTTSTEQYVVARYDSSGLLDTTFGTGGKVTGSISFGSVSRFASVLLQPDGRIVAAGSYNNGNDHPGAMRFSGDITVNFTAAKGGSIQGALNQTADMNGATTPVSAVADSGYHFVNWIDSNGIVYANSYLQLNNLTSNLTVTANFAADPVVTFIAGMHGSVTSSLQQIIQPNGSISPVSAQADLHYHFVNWTGTAGFTPTVGNPLSLAGVTADMTITANFAIDTQNLQFGGGSGGSVNGTTLQTVNYGASSTAVTAVPAAGFAFVNWTGPASFIPTTANPLTVVNVTSDMNITANFSDVAAPTISSFTIPATSASQTVSPVSIVASDNLAVTGYCLTDSNTPPTASGSCWTAVMPTSYSCAATGTQTLYLWLKDAANNISSSRYATVTIQDTTAPVVSFYPFEVYFSSSTARIALLANEPATIYYTTDGSDPTTSSPVYVAPIPVAGAFTLKYFARDSAGNSSGIGLVPLDLLSSPLPTAKVSGPDGNTTVDAVVLSPAFATDNTLIAAARLWYISTDRGTTWQPLGADGVFSNVQFSPAFAIDHTMFATGGNGGSILLKSVDSGTTWLPVAALPETTTSLYVSPAFSDDATLFAFSSSSSNAFISRNGGKSWARYGARPTGWIRKLKFSPGYASDHTILFGTTDGLFKSVDAGQNWIQSNTGITGSKLVSALAIAPDGTYFTSFNDGYSSSTTNKVYKSSDGGATWQPPVNVGNMSTAYDIAVAPDYATSHRLYIAAYSNGVFTSIDGGNTWSNSVTALDPIYQSTCYALAISPAFASDHQLFVGSYDRGIARSSNGGTSWSSTNKGLRMFGGTILLSPAYATDQTMFSLTSGSDKLLKSSDNGANWTSYPTLPSNHTTLLSLLLSPTYATDTTLWVGGYGGVYKSTDNGATWAYHTAGYQNLNLVAPLGATTPNTLFSISQYQSVDTGIYRSSDGGDTWSKISSMDVIQLVLSPSYTYSHNPVVFVVDTAGQLQKSADAGATWAPIATPGTVTAIMLSPAYGASDTTLVAVTSAKAVIYSADDGATWSTLPPLPLVAAAGTPDSITSIVIPDAFANSYRTIFAGGPLGLYRFTIGDTGWLHVPLDAYTKAAMGNYIHTIVPSPAFSSDRTLFVHSWYDGILKVVLPDGPAGPGRMTFAPGINTFTLPTVSSTLQVSPIILAAAYKAGTASYCLQELNSTTGCVWSTTIPTSYSFASTGIKKLYAWVKDSDGRVSAAASTTVAVGIPLSLSIAGSGSGSASGTLPCTSGVCSAAYTSGSSVTASATAAPGSFFAGWSGACSGTGSCTFTMNSSSYLIATFSQTRNVRNLNSGETFLPLQAAFDAAQTGEKLQARTGTFIENLLLNRPISITISGGYDSSYGSATGFSTIQGNVVLANGSLTADGMILK